MDSFCTYYDFFVHLKLIPTQQQRKKTPFTYNSYYTSFYNCILANAETS